MEGKQTFLQESKFIYGKAKGTFEGKQRQKILEGKQKILEETSHSGPLCKTLETFYPKLSRL